MDTKLAVHILFTKAKKFTHVFRLLLVMGQVIDRIIGNFNSCFMQLLIKDEDMKQ